MVPLVGSGRRLMTLSIQIGGGIQRKRDEWDPQDSYYPMVWCPELVIQQRGVGLDFIGNPS